jgi:hypothetical protein
MHKVNLYRNYMLQALLKFCILQPRYMHDVRGNKCIQRVGENEGRPRGIILKWTRKTGSGDETGLNSLHLRASLVTFMYI